MDHRSKSATPSRAVAKGSRKGKPVPAVLPESAAAARAREFAWTGQHERAVATCDEALTSEKSGEARLELLDLRAESLIALGRFDDAAADATAMLETASAGGTSASRARALNRRALVEMRQGKLDDAVATARRALGYAKDARNERLHAETGMPIIIAKNPLYSVVQGSGQCLENFDVLKGVLSSTQQ